MRYHMLLMTLLSIVVFNSNAAQTTFGAASTLINHGFTVTAFAFGDLDNDNDDDFVCNFIDSNIIIGINNKHGSMNKTILYRLSHSIKSLDIGDADQDGDNDILIGNAPAVSSEKKIYVLLNNKTGLWGDSVVIATSLQSICKVKFVDIDNDNDLDIAALGNINNTGELFWYERKNNSWIEHSIDTLIASGSTYTYWMTSADFNNDSLIDFVTGTNGGTYQNFLNVYTNNGNGTYKKSIISTSFPSNCGATGDINLDGHCDFFTGKQWFQNSGKGTFTQTGISNPPAYEADDVAIADVNNDGYPDCASASYNEGIYIWQNINGTSFNRTLLANTSGSKKIAFSDINTDGFVDIACLNDMQPKLIEWIQNLASCAFERKVLFKDSVLVNYDIADIDTDGDFDLFLLSQINADHYNYISALENNGIGGFTKKYRTSSSYIAGRSSTNIVKAVDFNGDKGVDMVIHEGAELYWLKQTDINTFTKSMIRYTGDSLKAFQVIDLDCDGNLDILAQFKEGQYTNLGGLRNNGDGTFTYSKQNGGVLLAGGDFNGDKHADYITHDLYIPQTSAIYFNKGDGTFVRTDIPGSDSIVPNDVNPVDLDSDGDCDFVVASKDSSGFGWFENVGDTDNDGFPNFVTRILQKKAFGATEVEAGDIDKDGRVDVLLYRTNDSTLYWMKQDTNKIFFSNLLVSSGKSIRMIRLIDFDKDGWIDIVCAEGNNVVLYRNLLGTPKAKPQIPVVNREIQSSFINKRNIDVNVDRLRILKISSPAPFSAGAHIELFQADGRIILKKSLDEQQSININLSHIGGIVIWRIFDSEHRMIANGRYIQP